MKFAFSIACALLGAWMTGAVIGEQPGATGTPAANPSVASAASSAEPEQRFAGIWQGGLFRSGSGNTDQITVFVDLKKKTATVSNFFPGPQTGRIEIEGNTITWKWMLATWKMTVSENGQTAKIDGDSVFEACRGNLARMFDH